MGASRTVGLSFSASVKVSVRVKGSVRVEGSVRVKGSVSVRRSWECPVLSPPALHSQSDSDAQRLARREDLGLGLV